MPAPALRSALCAGASGGALLLAVYNAMLWHGSEDDVDDATGEGPDAALHEEDNR